MGTSVSNASPDTLRWNAINRQYDFGGGDPKRLLRDVVVAAGQEFAEQLANRAVEEAAEVVASVGASLAKAGIKGALDEVGATTSERPVSALASATRRCLSQRLAWSHSASRLSDLAVRAAMQTVVQALTPVGSTALDLSITDVQSRIERLKPSIPLALTRSFTALYLENAVNYLVTRDVGGHVGISELKTVNDAQKLVSEIQVAVRHISQESLSLQYCLRRTADLAPIAISRSEEFRSALRDAWMAIGQEAATSDARI